MDLIDWTRGAVVARLRTAPAMFKAAKVQYTAQTVISLEHLW